MKVRLEVNSSSNGNSSDSSSSGGARVRGDVGNSFGAVVLCMIAGLAMAAL
jgi:hypothetical protein